MTSTLSKRVLTLVVTGASALSIATTFLGEKEGMRYKAYKDGNGQWSICMGITAGVKQGDVMTQAQCDARDEEAVDGADADVERLVHVPMSRPERAALISFCGYNLGYTKCSKSGFLALLNAGKRTEACERIKDYVKDGGKDCRYDKSCRGQLLRRDQEYELCLMD